MILKVHALVRYLAQLRQRKNLITAAVRQNWHIPVHKFMQPPKVANDFKSWSHKQVVSIPEYDLRVEFAKLARADGFDASLRPDRHEGRCVDYTMPSFDPPDARFCAFIRRYYFEHRLNLENDYATRKQAIVAPEHPRALADVLLDCVWIGLCLSLFAALLSPAGSNVVS